MNENWISIHTKKPFHGQQVLVNIERKIVSDRVRIGLYVDDPVRWYSGGFPDPNITHWMPLPDPVTERENKEEIEERVGGWRRA